MRQFDFYENPFASSRAIAPYLIFLSSHLMRQADVVIAAPLVRDRQTPIEEIEVRLTVRDEGLILSLADMGGMEAKTLKRRLGSLLEHEDAIRRGISQLFTGL